MSTVPEDTKQFSAEAATTIASDFLKRLGYKKGLFPRKAVLSEKVFTIEIDIEKESAKVQIDSQTKTVTEFEIHKAEEESSSPILSKKKIIILVVIAGVIAAVGVGIKLMGIL